MWRPDFSNGWTGGQYSVFRALLGVVLGVELIGLFRRSGLLLSRDSVTASGPLSLFRDPLGHVPPAVMAGLLILGIVLAGLLALGVRDRSAAAGLWVLLSAVVARDPLLASPVSIAAVLVLVFHLATPPAPWGSLAARGRVDPGGRWRLPTRVVGAAWLAAGTLHFLRGLSLLPRLEGRSLLDLVDGPLGRPGWWSSILLELPSGAWAAAAGIAAVTRLTFLPLGLFRRLRPGVWAITAIVLLVETVVLNPFFLDGGLLLLHVLLFDPAWIRPKPRSEATARIFYDGHCGLCHRWIRFVLAEDPTGTAFRFAPLQGSTFADSVPASDREELPDSVVVQLANGRLLVRSAAALWILRRLGGLWRLSGSLGHLIPPRLRDTAYDGIARVRGRLFGAPDDVCPLLPPAHRRRFDP